MLSTSFIKIYQSNLDLLKKEINAYADDTQLWIVKNDINNSAGNLALHLIGNLNHFIGAILGNTGYRRNRPAEFSSKNISRQTILHQIDETIEVITQVFCQLDDTELNMPYPILYNEREVTIGYMLVHLSAHLNYHLGQINYHRRLLTPLNQEI